MYSPVFNRESTLDLIGISEDIPTLPDRFVRIQRVIDDPHSSMDKLVDIIHTDQATCTMILKVANSAGRNPTGRAISTLSQAISLLGIKEISHIALGMSLMYGFALPLGMGHARAFWTHAFSSAMTCEFLAAKLAEAGEKQIDGKEAFMAGLLHDIGRAIIGLRVDLSYFESPLMLLHGDELMEAEHQRYGIDHAEAGAHTLTLWNFPPVLVQAVAEHHQSTSANTLARMVQIACQLTHEHSPNGMQIDEVPDFLQNTLFDAVTAEVISELASV